MERLKVGLLGLGRGGQRVAEALLASTWCDLVAVASPRRHRLERFAEHHPGIATYDDFRSLIVGCSLDALFVALPPFVRAAYLKLAAARDLPVWMLTPAARKVSEAAQILAMFSHDCPVVVARNWGIDESMQPTSPGIDTLGRIFLARGNVMTRWSEDFDWRGDSRRAGGGVLLDRGYGLVDTVVNAMGLPGTVYAAMAGASRPGGKFPYDTEDTAGMVCQYADGGMAVISACWTAGPDRWYLVLNGIEGSVRFEETRMQAYDRSGEATIEEQQRLGNPFLPPIENFLSQLQSNPRKIQGHLRTHLPTIATIEAAYLSARTGEKESPERILDVHDDPGRSRR